MNLRPEGRHDPTTCLVRRRWTYPSLCLFDPTERPFGPKAGGGVSLLVPKRVKYRKAQRGKRRGIAWRGSDVAMGEFGLQALENAWVSNKQLEAARVALSRHVKAGGMIYLRVYPDKPITKKPAETRMGRGKGMPEQWVAVVKRGRILFEMEGVPEGIAKDAMRIASSKLPIRTRFVSRAHAGGGMA